MSKDYNDRWTTRGFTSMSRHSLKFFARRRLQRGDVIVRDSIEYASVLFPAGSAERMQNPRGEIDEHAEGTNYRRTDRLNGKMNEPKLDRGESRKLLNGIRRISSERRGQFRVASCERDHNQSVRVSPWEVYREKSYN